MEQNNPIHPKSDTPRAFVKSLAPGYAVNSDISVSIIIPVTESKELLKRCMESVKKHTPEAHERIFVLGETDEDTKNRLKQHIGENPNDIIAAYSGNGNLAAMVNGGINASKGRFLVLLSSDVIVTEKWLSGMLECINSIPDAGIVGAMPHHQNGPMNVAVREFGSVEHLDDDARLFRERNRHRRIPSRTVSGFCVLFRRDLVDKIGFLEERFSAGGFATEEFCFRAALEGYKNLIAGDVLIHRLGSGNHGGTGTTIHTADKVSDKRLFAEKWGGMDAETALGKKFVSLKVLEKAGDHHQRGEIDAAIDVLLEGIGHCPGDERLYYALSEILIDAEQPKDALDVLNQLQTDERNSRRLELTGYCKAGMGLYEDAQAIADLLISQNPDSASALNLKGILSCENVETAETFFKKAIASDPGYGEPYTRLGTLKWHGGEEQEALRLLEKGFILSPTIGDMMTTYHAAIASLGLFERAEPPFREAKLLHPNHERLNLLFIDILIKQKKYDSAMKEIENAMVAFTVNDGFLSAALKIRDLLGPKEITAASDNKGTVSLCMIVKNEADDLAKCLSSVKPFVDEMILVDTGSNDNTREIARAFGTKVYDFKWTDDFSEARNFSISKAKGDWIFLLDADEVVSPRDFDLFKSIIREPSAAPAAYSFVTRNYIPRANTVGWVPNDGKYDKEEAAEGWIPSDKVRLFPNETRIRFEYPVHEMVEPSLSRAGLKVIKCAMPIHHYGKLNREKSDCKGEVYYLIGRKKLEESGNDPIAIRELAIQAGLLKKWEEAIELWRKLISIKPDTPEAYVNLGTAHWHLGEYDKSLSAAKKAIALAPHMKESAYNYAICQLHMGNAEQAVWALETLLKRYPGYLPAQFMLTAAYCCDGQKEKGMRGFERLRKTNTGPYLAISCHELAKGFLSAQNLNYAVLLLDAAVEGGNINKDILALFSECLKMKRGAA